jgi:hypothetical protein
MPTRTRVKIVSNSTPKVRRALNSALQKRVPVVATRLRDDLQKAVFAGALPLQPDTGALGDSLAVQTAKGSDFDERRQKAKDAYLNNDSLWRESVREHVTKEAYTEQHFEQRAATEEPTLTQDQYVARAAILSMLAWGYLWEYGHYNYFTGKAEHRPWFGPFVLEWWEQNGKSAFEGFYK